MYKAAIRARLMRERARDKQRARKAREAARRAARKAKRAVKAAPRLALQAWSANVRKRGMCEVCGNSENIQAHHILPKERYPEFKLEPLNGIALCPLHHKFGKYSFHRNPLWSMVWLSRNMKYRYKWAVFNMGDFE